VRGAQPVLVEQRRAQLRHHVLDRLQRAVDQAERIIQPLAQRRGQGMALARDDVEVDVER
jgi:hypothetical protein